MIDPVIGVDVVILSWGRVQETCAAIDSALAQTGVDVHVQIVDQGTEASELQVIKDHVAGRSRVTLVCNDTNRGVPGGRNQGTALGQAAYVVALDNDAEFDSDRELAKAVALMEADRTIGALAFRIALFSTGEDDRSSWPYPLAMNPYSTRRFTTARFVGAGHMLRRESFEAVGAYDDRLIFLHEEVDLSYRLINGGCSIVYDPSVVIRHKVSAENRVSWSGKRYYFHVRNTTYMAAKYNFPLPSATLGVIVAVAAGLKSGYAAGTLKGLLHGILLAPHALRQRWGDRRVRLTDDARARIRATSPTRDMSLIQKVRYRLQPWLGSAR